VEADDVFAQAHEANKQQAAEEQRAKAYGSLLGGGEAPARVKLNSDAGMAYLEFMARGRQNKAHLIKQDVGREGRLAHVFDQMATAEERAKLLPTRGEREQADIGQRRLIVANLAELLRARYAAYFEEADQQVPKALQPGGMLPTSAIENRERGLKALGVDVKADTFEAWRAAYVLSPPSAAQKGKKRARS
jgi:hypothetical protein